MKLFIKQRVFSWGAKFDIMNENGEPVYFCKGKVFTFGKKLYIYDQTGRELVYIEQELFHLMPHYNIYIEGKHEVTIVRKFSFFKHNYNFKGNDWLINGDFWAHTYNVSSGNNLVMSISKRWFTWGDTYEIDLNDAYNPLLCLAAAITIDCVCHSSDGQ